MVIRLTAPRPLLWSILADLLIAIGLGAVLYAAWFLVDGAVYQRAQKAEFVRPMVAEVAPPKVVEPAEPASPLEADSGLIGELKIANVDLDVMVGEGLDKQTLRRAAGHPEWSARPGEPGNLILLGHRDTFFRPLRGLKRGDVAEIRTKAGVFRYRIHRIRIVAPEDVDVAQDLNRSELTLVTCYPFYFVGPSPRRFVAQGRLIEEQGN